MKATLQHRNRQLDALGATASLLCAVHCALLPLVITFLPLWGLSVLADATFEWAMIGAAALFGLGSFCLGYRQHRSRRVFAILAGALTLMVLGRILEAQVWSGTGSLLMVAGGLLLVAAHRLNHTLCTHCARCHPHA